MAVAICGDPVVGRLLVLLLGDSGYEVRFLPRSSLNEPATLEGVRLLLLAPTPELNGERRASLLALIKDIQESTGLIVLELVTLSEEGQREEARGESRGESWQLVPWPSRLPELKRRIEAALLEASNLGADRAAKIRELENKGNNV